MTRRAARSLDPDLRRTAWRIGLQTAALLMACLLVVGAVIYGAVVRSQDEQLAQTLRDAATTAGLGGDPDHDHDHDPTRPRGGIQYYVVDARGPRFSDALPPGLPDREVLQQVASTGLDDQRTLHLSTGAYEVFTTQRGDDTVQVAVNRLEQHQEGERILGALGLAGGAGLVLATLAAAVLARRAVQPMALALEQQRRFVADAGHELRTPLTLLSTRAQLLARRVRDRSAPAEQRERLVERDAAGIVTDTAALVAILEDLLTAADARTPVPDEPVDLAVVASAAVGAAQAAAAAAGRTLTMSGSEGPATVVRGAASALGRAVTALVDNAVDHARSRVEVRVAATGRDVMVEVLDDGPGIAVENLPRVFDRFASDRRDVVDPGPRRHFGLGLALVNEIAHRHGGTVIAVNRQPPGNGAVLTLTIPAAARTGSPRRAPGQATVPEAGSTGHPTGAGDRSDAG